MKISTAALPTLTAIRVLEELRKRIHHLPRSIVTQNGYVYWICTGKAGRLGLSLKGRLWPIAENSATAMPSRNLVFENWGGRCGRRLAIRQVRAGKVRACTPAPYNDLVVVLPLPSREPMKLRTINPVRCALGRPDALQLPAGFPDQWVQSLFAVFGEVGGEGGAHGRGPEALDMGADAGDGLGVVGVGGEELADLVGHLDQVGGVHQGSLCRNSGWE